MSEGAMTWQSMPNCRKRRAMPKPHGTGFVADAQFGAVTLVLAHPLLEDVEIVREGTRGTDLPIATVLRHRLGDRFFVDIQTNVENRSGCAFVCW